MSTSGQGIWGFTPLDKVQLTHARTQHTKKLNGPECRLLTVLLANQGKVVSKQELMANVWPNRVVSEGSLTQSIAQLRLAFGDSGKEQKYIKTVPHQGYLLFANVVELVERPHASTSGTAYLGAAKPHPDVGQRETTLPQRLGGVKGLLVMVLMLVTGIQTADVVHRYTFAWGVAKPTWQHADHRDTTYFYQDEPASRQLYHYLSDPTAGLQNGPIHQLLIAATRHHYNVSCVYGDVNQAKNLTFVLGERFDVIATHVDRACRSARSS
ncbi:winged helix-turn-helix domain-containing protein [Vibrio europaeus]|uniref:Winged helix-turn-helix domain-containing protein n=1 Tax=Vibrio europaeus TaxID=300876 RepID=A0A178J5G8_9VIBR|nr:winged helix-turn-helix domain-containing protein [Vibrio europaeus]MDC5706729.1 winged helix-turn-helix domain-containing protein [Vibrio europaeus]MDC5711736.1 winged helix-turn-helix domain-containing protein [Vibrio europaeus]MDC5716298.1 winged helix-turn-helix domain-containing protein [Vibrio europaeus]MDC5725869.1 winged helix-turn-helix domain-containing protein [Vibrio europaeus]MDC5732858.1 winged helix-turn-helix domain-containing protein [Vibrio europaeus]